MLKTAKTEAIVPLHIALVDGDKSVLVAIKGLAEREGWMLDYYPNGDQALEHIPFACPNVVLIDIIIPGLSGIDCAHKIKCHSPNVSVIMLTAHSDFENILFSLMAGATGYLLKPVSQDQVKSAILRAACGSSALCEEAQKALLTCFHRAFAATSIEVLSEREREIMACLIQQLSDKEISEHLHIAPNTVHVHLVRIFRRLGAHNRGDAIRTFFRRCIGSSCCYCRLNHENTGPRPNPIITDDRFPNVAPATN